MMSELFLSVSKLQLSLFVACDYFPTIQNMPIIPGAQSTRVVFGSKKKKKRNAADRPKPDFKLQAKLS